MYEDTLQASPVAPDHSEAAESSQWTFVPSGDRTRANRSPAHLPACPSGRDAYPVMELGTPSSVSPERILEVAEQPLPEWHPFPTPRRRREPRYNVTEDRIWIQWWSDGEFNGLSGRLVNVSRHGALIVVASKLRERQPLRVTMEDPEIALGVDALVLGSVEGGSGLNTVRLGFLTPCPEEFFHAVSDGFEAWLSGRRNPR